MFGVGSVVDDVITGAIVLVPLGIFGLIGFRFLLREIRANRRDFIIAITTGRKPPEDTPPNGGTRQTQPARLRYIRGGQAAGLMFAAVAWLRHHPKSTAAGGALMAVATVALVASVPLGTSPGSAAPTAPSQSESAPHSYTTGIPPQVLAAPPEAAFPSGLFTASEPTGVAAEVAQPLTFNSPHPTTSTSTLTEPPTSPTSGTTATTTELAPSSCLIGVQVDDLANVCVD